MLNLWYCTNCRSVKFYPDHMPNSQVEVTEVKRNCVECNRSTYWREVKE
jgi:hypothetical protein